MPKSYLFIHQIPDAAVWLLENYIYRFTFVNLR